MKAEDGTGSRRSAWMRKGVYNEDVALQPHSVREFASKLFVLEAFKNVPRVEMKNDNT